MDYIIRPGDLAYLDTFSGLVPCKYIGLNDERKPVVKLTATRQAYKKGEEIPASHLHVIARDQVFTRSGQLMIRGRTTLADA